MLTEILFNELQEQFPSFGWKLITRRESNKILYTAPTDTHIESIKYDIRLILTIERLHLILKDLSTIRYELADPGFFDRLYCDLSILKVTYDFQNGK